MEHDGTQLLLVILTVFWFIEFYRHKPRLSFIYDLAEDCLTNSI